MGTDKQRFTVSLDDDLFKEIEKVRFDNHFDNRALAINYVLNKGIEAMKDGKDTIEEKDIKATRKKRSEKK